MSISMMRIMAAACSFLLDVLSGDPAWLPHPVIAMGRAIQWLESKFRSRFPGTRGGELFAGFWLAAVMVLGTLAGSGLAVYLAGRLHIACRFALEVFWGWQCLAMRGLAEESRNVRKCLEEGTLPEAREAVARIVGRDTRELAGSGVIRAAVESVAENFSDGVMAPMLYLMLGGAPFALCYKAINTMDSMIGYKNERYMYFGRCAARLDDAVNWIPARLSALLLIGAAVLTHENAGGAWKIWRRDRRKHESPNSAQTEAAMAGALGIRLGGPASYFGEVHDKPWLGDSTKEPEPGDIERAERMMWAASVLGLFFLGALRLLIYGW